MFGIKLLNGIAPIVQAGDPVLRKEARRLSPTEIRSHEVQELIEVMKRTMQAAPGVGLAAPQIGVDLQIAVIEDKSEYTKDVAPAFLAERERRPVSFHTVINPVLTPIGIETREFFEGCLSVQGFTAVVSRLLQVQVQCLDGSGREQTIKASGWYARILQHEIDHLKGTLYIDRMKSRTFSGLALFETHCKGKSMAEIQKTIGWD